MQNSNTTKVKKYFPHAVFIFILLIFLSSLSLYVVDQRQFAIELQFGEVKKVRSEPGLKMKIPFIREVVFFDNRIQNVAFHSGDANEVLTVDQKTLKLDAFAKYKVVDPLAFYRAVKDDSAFKRRLTSILESAIRESTGTVTFIDVLRSKRTNMLENIAAHVNKQVDKFGVEVLDVRITTVSLPEQSRVAVYNRMRTDRDKEAAEIRAIGQQEARIIMAQTERDREIMIAEARKQANILVGEGDAEAARIFVEAAKKDSSFYSFYKSLDTYRRSMQGDKTSMIISSRDNALFEMMKGKDMLSADK